MDDQEAMNTRFDSPIKAVREPHENSNGGVLFHLMFVSEVLTSTSLVYCYTSLHHDVYATAYRDISSRVSRRL
jgi:hypothetical protein